MEPDVDDPTENGYKDTVAVYGALVQLAVHGQENKWWMLYIFLMFNSILLLGCAALFGTGTYTGGHRILLGAFSVVGVLIDVCWIFMAVDYVEASNLYSDKVVEAEDRLPAHLPKPLTERKQ